MSHSATLRFDAPSAYFIINRSLKTIVHHTPTRIGFPKSPPNRPSIALYRPGSYLISVAGHPENRVTNSQAVSQSSNYTISRCTRSINHQ